MVVSNEVKDSKLICQSNDNKRADETKANIRATALAPRAIGQKKSLKCFGVRNRGNLEEINSIMVAPDTRKYIPIRVNMRLFIQVLGSPIATSMVMAASKFPAENIISFSTSLPRIRQTMPVDI